MLEEVAEHVVGNAIPRMKLVIQSVWDLVSFRATGVGWGFPVQVKKTARLHSGAWEAVHKKNRKFMGLPHGERILSARVKLRRWF